MLQLACREGIYPCTHLRHKEDSKKKGHSTQSLHGDHNCSHTCILHCKDGCHSDCDSKEEGVCGQSDQLGLPQLRYVDLPVLHSKHTANDGQHQFVAGQDNEGDVGVTRHAVNVLLKRGRLHTRVRRTYRFSIWCTMYNMVYSCSIQC